MANINRVHLLGRITHDIEVRHTPKGTAVTSLNIATNRHRTDDQGNKAEETCFTEVTLWGRNAELAGEYLGKGREVYIEGRLDLQQWDDKATGQKRTKLRVIGEQMQFIGGKPDGTGTNQTAQQKEAPVNQSVPSNRPGHQDQPPHHSEIDTLEGDDIPF